MSEMRKSFETEDYIKLQWAETHEGITTSTWNSPEFKQFRNEQIKKLNEQFTEWMGPDSYGASLYEKQSTNSVYQKSEGRNFRKERLGVESGLANRLKLWKMEAENEFDSGYGKAYIHMQSGDFAARKFVSPVAGNFHRALYRGLHMMERAGGEMVKYGASDTKKDLDNPLKLVGKKLFMVPFGATIATGGAVLKFVVNPMYPFQSLKRAYENWQKKKAAKPKHMSLKDGARLMEMQRANIRYTPTQFRSQEFANAASTSRSRGAAFRERAGAVLRGEARQPTIAAPEKTSKGLKKDKGREL